MVLPNDVRQLVILIPNEGHHGPGEEDEARFIAQPFVPQHAFISPGTVVVWFNGDIGHEHNIVVTSACLFSFCNPANPGSPGGEPCYTGGSSDRRHFICLYDPCHFGFIFLGNS